MLVAGEERQPLTSCHQDSLAARGEEEGTIGTSPQFLPRFGKRVTAALVLSATLCLALAAAGLRIRCRRGEEATARVSQSSSQLRGEPVAGVGLWDLGGFVDSLKKNSAELVHEGVDQAGHLRDEAAKKLKNATGEAAKQLKNATGEAAKQLKNATGEAAETVSKKVAEKISEAKQQVSDQLKNYSLGAGNSSADEEADHDGVPGSTEAPAGTGDRDEEEEEGESSDGSTGVIAAPTASPNMPPAADPTAVPTPSPAIHATGAIHWTTHPEFCVDVSNDLDRPYDGTKVQTWPCPGSKFFRMPSGGRGQIRWETFPEFCLHVANGGAFQSNPSAVTDADVWSCSDASEAANMDFSVPEAGAGKISWATNPSLCLNVEHGAAAPAAKINWMSCDGDVANKDFFVPSQCRKAPPEGPIIWVTNPSRCFSGRSGGRGTGMLEMMACTPGDESQGFKLPACNIGQIEWMSSGLCIRVKPNEDGSERTDDGAEVGLWNCSDAKEQRNMIFTLPFEESGGSVKLTSVMWAAAAGPIRWTRQPWLCIDVKDGIETDGAQLQLWGCPVNDEEHTANKNFILPADNTADPCFT